MTEPPKVRAWAVTLVFGNGPISHQTIYAPTAHEATAMCATIALRSGDIPAEYPLSGVACLELTLEWLRQTVMTLETGKTSGIVLSLVDREPLPPITEGNATPAPPTHWPA